MLPRKCMGSEDKAMTQFTKKAIMDAFVELLDSMPFDKISVVDIAEKCRINRNTFYYHYPDIYALVDELFKTETQKIIDRNEAFDSWQEAFLQALHFARENRSAIYHLFYSAAGTRLEKYIYDVTLSNITAFVRRQADDLNVSEKEISVLSEFYTIALIGMFTKWIGEGMNRDFIENINEMGEILDGNIRYTLEKCDSRRRLDKTP